MIEVFAIRLLDDEVFLSIKENLLELLPVSGRNFYTRFRRISGLQRSLFGELLSRAVLSRKLGIHSASIVFNKSENGKPYLDNRKVHFNLTHSGNWVVMAMAEAEVGIDIELIRPINYRIAERFFSPAEVRTLNSKMNNDKLEYFFELWTLKESYLKLIGTGLTRSLNSFTIYHEDKRFHIRENEKSGASNIFFKQYPIEDGYKISVCSHTDLFSEKIERITVEYFFSKNDHGG
jgi:4'-phosphopantetheinyl transferase